MLQVQPLLVIRNSVLFPHMVVPITAGRDRSIAAVEAALEGDRTLVVVTQRDLSLEEPGQDDLYNIGTRVTIQKATRGQNGFQVVLQGVERVRLVKLEPGKPYLQARIQPMPIQEDNSPAVEALHRSVLDLSGELLSLLGQTQRQGAQALLDQLTSQLTDPMQLAYYIAGFMKLDIEKEQQVLEASSRLEALELIHRFLAHELEVQQVRQRISSQVQSEMGKEQKDYLLRQQMRAIQNELGEDDSEKAEIEMLREKLDEAQLPEDARKEADRELKRLERLNPASPDHSLTRGYLELLAELPWQKNTDDNHDLKRARAILDEDHFGLKTVKERILEHLAVMKLNSGAKAPIVLLVGPPGVGKTSLGQSIARALERKFERLSLGGLHDEAELRGHRRTYIGALPGRLIQAVRRAGVKNPVLMLDEVDKIGSSYRGDPASALLEVIDPAQNDKFRDNYLDLPFDLSKALFILTANTTDSIPRPLLDRMEVIRLSGYSEEEKLQIARRYLLPRVLKEAGIGTEQVQVDDPTLGFVVARYTREAGVRELERTLAKLVRKLALRFAEGDPDEIIDLKADQVSELLGPERYQPESARQEKHPGVATGLAWTEVGGDVLYVESLPLPGGTGLTLTGQLGDVMKESAQAALSYVQSKARNYGLTERTFRNEGIHVHVPAGAIPKDGPSAGVTMAVSLLSAYTGVPARKDLAMTGEITLTGLVLPVGGIKEKVLAARRLGIHTIILPCENEKDLRELPDNVRAEMEFHPVAHLDDVFAIALPDLERRGLSIVQSLAS
ncbi:endopeptidase La [bacterium]|nr:endopeptidase La [bacterium]